MINSLIAYVHIAGLETILWEIYKNALFIANPMKNVQLPNEI